MESRHPHLCVINKTLRNPISFEIPPTGALLSPARLPSQRHSSHEARRNVSCTFYQLVPSITTLLDFKKVRKVRRECEKSSVVSFFVFSNFIRYFIWHSTNTLLNSRRNRREREVGTEDEKFDSKAFFELHTSLCSLCLAPNFSSAILLQQRAGVTTEFSQSYVLQLWGRWKKTIHERQRCGEMNFCVLEDRP